MSDDLIKRKDAIKAFTFNSKGERIPFVDCDNFPVEFPLRYIVDTLVALLPADRPQGEWIAGRVGHGPGYTCSLCNYGVAPWNNTPYCPNCGARMFAKDINVPNKEGADDETD